MESVDYSMLLGILAPCSFAFFVFECANYRQNLKIILEESKSIESEKEMEVVV